MESKLQITPTAGYLLNIDKQADPGPITTEESSCLRSLAEQVALIAEKPKQAEKRKLWYRHNDLNMTRPLSLVFPEDSWFELLPVSELMIADPYWRQWEWYFQHIIYRDEHIDDDFVIETKLWVSAVVHQTGWGLQARYEKKQDKGSYAWDPPVKLKFSAA